MRVALQSMEAALEASLWLRGQLEFSQPLIKKGARVQTVFDSSYVICAILGAARLRRNVVLVAAVRTAWRICCLHFQMGKPRWTKSHAGDVGNEMADTLADAGASSAPHDAKISSRPYFVEWNEDELRARLAAIPIPVDEQASLSNLSKLGLENPLSSDRNTTLIWTTLDECGGSVRTRQENEEYEEADRLQHVDAGGNPCMSAADLAASAGIGALRELCEATKAQAFRR